MIPEKLGKIVEWTKLKVRIEAGGEQEAYFYDREIWWASLGANIGFEEDGKNKNFERPVLVLKRFNRRMLWALPLSSKLKSNEYYHTFDIEGEKYSVILPQIRLISSKRLIRKMRKVPPDVAKVIVEKIKSYL